MASIELEARSKTISPGLRTVHADAMQRVARRIAGMERHAANDLRGDATRGGHAVMRCQLAAATVNCRVLPEDTEQYVLDTLKKVIADDQVAFNPLGARTKGPASEMRPDVMQAVNSVTDTSGRACQRCRSW